MPALSLSSGVIECTLQPQAGYALQVAQVSRHQLQIMVDRGRHDLQIGMRQRLNRSAVRAARIVT